MGHTAAWGCAGEAPAAVASASGDFYSRRTLAYPLYMKQPAIRLGWLVALLACSLATSANASEEATGQRSSQPPQPDLLVVVLDSWRADALMREIDGEPVMPRLREWAKSATVFTDARAPSPSTPTSVSSLMISMPVRAYEGSFKHGIPNAAVTVAEVLGRAGYENLGFSSNPNCRSGLGHADGFDAFLEAFSDEKMREDQRLIQAGHPESLIPPDVLLNRVRKDLAAVDEGQPVFAYVHVMQPHAPYSPEPPHLGMFTEKGMMRVSVELKDILKRDRKKWFGTRYLEALRARYDEHVHYTDAAVGDFLEWVDAHPRWRNAATVVTSDHGEAFGEHGRLLHNTTLYEEMLLVPMIARSPGGPGEHREVDERVGLLDLAPTLCAYAGVDAPPTFDGVDLSPLIRGDDATPRASFLASTAIIPSRKTDALVIGDLKLIRSPEETKLFDLAEDPEENVDLAATRVERRETMEDALDLMLERLEKMGVGRAGESPTDERLEKMLESLGYAGVQ